jgi:hypothetical protein
MKNKFTLAFIAASFLMSACCTSSQNTAKLFNGKDLTGWGCVVADNNVPASDVFSVQDGVINVKGQPFGYLYTEEEYENYILHVEWRWTEGASNSGIFLAMEDLAAPAPKCVECQLESGNAGDFIAIGGSGLTPLIGACCGEAGQECCKNADQECCGEAGQECCKIADPTKNKNESSENPVGEWNCADISVKDGVITIYINGVWQNSGIAQVKKGRIGLQSEGKGIQFRNVTLTKW